MSNVLIVLAVKVLTPILVGVVTPFVLDALKKANAALDAAPPYVKQGAAIAIAALITALSNLLGMELPQDIATWDTTAVKALVAGFLAIAVKQHQQLAKLKGQ
jgi:hypothetical protein